MKYIKTYEKLKLDYKVGDYILVFYNEDDHWAAVGVVSSDGHNDWGNLKDIIKKKWSVCKNCRYR